jgi:3',5'-cyclic AMP phosphodiesterase CpdA
MPLHLARLSRRSFLAQGAVAAAGLATAGLATLPDVFGAERQANPNQLALLSDTHIPSAPEVTARDTNMTSNLKQVVREVTALETQPACVIVNGDCAYLKGLPADYANFSQCIAPLSEAGLPVHLTMGNHDDRAPLFNALKSQKPERPLVESKHVSIVQTPHANWFLLDSLTKTDVVTGELGADQRAWLAKALNSRSDKPALVMAHHNPQFEPPAEGKEWGGIRDTAEFMELLGSFKHVKAFIFGHSHDWSIKKRGSLHLVNLPPVAYVFTAGKPNGWVLVDVAASRLTLTLYSIDPHHRQHGQRVELAW